MNVTASHTRPQAPQRVNAEVLRVRLQTSSRAEIGLAELEWMIHAAARPIPARPPRHRGAYCLKFEFLKVPGTPRLVALTLVVV